MQPTRGVLTRVLMTVLSLALVAGALMAGAIVAARPADAAARRPDALADAAAVALAELGERAAVRAAVAGYVLASGDPVVASADSEFAVARQAVAALAAPRAGVDPAALDAVWAGTTDQRLTAVLAALSQVGVPYRGYKAIPGVGFDCSGLTSYAWGVAGVALAHNSSAQINGARGKALTEVEPGDLVQYPGHVMMSLGLGTAIVHAPRTGQTIEVRAWRKARRVGSPV